MRMTNRMQEENGMYHCHIHFYLAGRQKRLFEYIKGMPPLEHFTHSFIESDTPQEALAARADVILADLHSIDAKDALRILTFGKVREAELILLADKEQTMALHWWIIICCCPTVPAASAPRELPWCTT